MASYTATVKGTQKLYGFYGNGNGATYTITVTNGTGVMKKFDVIRRPIRGGIPNVVQTGYSGTAVTYTENARFDFELEIWADVTTAGTFTATVTSSAGGDNITMATLVTDSSGKAVGITAGDGSPLTWGLFTPPLIAFGGDSITADARATPDFTNWGWVTHFRRMLVGRADIRPENIFAVAGQGVDSLNNVQIPQILASGAPIVCIKIGTNDVDTVDIIAGLTKAYATLTAAGKILIVSPILPHSTPTSFTTAQKKIVDRVNRWIFNAANTSTNIYYAPTLKYITDYSTGDAASGMLRDGIHTTPDGAYAVARGFFEAADAILPAQKWTSTVDVGIYDAATNPTGDILSNGLMRGTGGTLRNGASGTTPTGWWGQRSSGASTVTAAFSKTAISGLIGAEASLMTLGGTGDNGYVGLESTTFSLPSGVVAGDTLLFRAKVEWAGLTGITGFEAVIRTLDGSAATVQMKDGLYSTGNGTLGAVDGSYWLECRLTLPVGVNTPSVRLEVASKTSAAVAGTVKFSFADLRKV